MSEIQKRRHDPLTGTFTSKLTPAVIDKIDVALRAGAPMSTAARFAGISTASFDRYLSDGRALLEAWDGHSEIEDPRDLLRMRLVWVVDEALAEFKISLTGTILQAGQGGAWQALAWLAERRFPDEFGRRQRIEHANPEGEAFRVAPTPVFDPSKLTDDELETAIGLLEKARPDGMRPLVREAGEGLRVIEG